MSQFIRIELLEPYDAKVSRTVLRGERGSNASDLPDKKVYDALISVKNIISDSYKVYQSVEMLIEITEIYTSGYTRLLAESNEVITELKDIVSVTSLSISDKERMDMVDKAYREVRRHRYLVNWRSYNFAEEQREKIYVLDEGKSLMLALSQDLTQNRPIEARDHIRRFHELFFTLSPDKAAIEGNIERALSLNDRSGYNIYTDLLEKGYHNRIISDGMNQQIKIESVECDMDVYPYKVTYKAVQSIIRESNITERSLVTTCNSVRSDNNPQGFTIEKFEIIENNDIRVIKR